MIRILLALLTLSSSAVFAQNSIHHPCATDKAMERVYRIPGQREEMDKAEQRIREYIEQHQNKLADSGGTTYYHIPVVVHVIHTGGAVGTIYNPSDADIIGMVNSMNDIYGNLFDDPSVAGTYNSVNIPIRFSLAQRNPSCAATTGITRYNYSSNATYVADGVTPDFGLAPGIDDSLVKAIDLWPVSDYYNIWVVNKIEGMDGTSGTFTAGYALLPNTYISNADGTIILATQVYPNNITLAHELGHAFSLRHPFQGYSGVTCPGNSNCATDNDLVCDTDPELLDFTCNPSGTNSCTGNTWASSTIQYNIMGYHGCTDRFTAGQSTKALASLLTQRVSLASSLGTDAPPAQSVVAASCNPTNLNPANNFGIGPINVNFNEIQYNSVYYTANTNYSSGVIDDKTCNHQTTIYKSVGSYPIQVVTTINAQRVKAFIDYNNDGIFVTGTEIVLNSPGTAGTYTHTATVTIPASGVVYDTPLRLRVMADNSANTSYNACSALNYGQAEDFTVIIAQAPLPLIWKEVSAETNKDGRSIDIKWSTAQEQQVEGFEIERSANGQDFIKIADQKSYGSNLFPNYYEYKDSKPLGGTNYYRIKQIDVDGKSTYSNIVEAHLNKSISSNISVYPNPANTDLSLAFETNTACKGQMQILDLSGKVVFQQAVSFSASKNTEQLNIAHLAKGVYFVKCTLLGKQYSSKFIKQ